MINILTTNDASRTYAAFSSRKDIFPHVRADYVKRQLESGSVYESGGVFIIAGKYKKNVNLQGTIIPKGAMMLHQIVNTGLGNGSASKVFDEWAQAVGADIYLSVRANNDIARRFYEHKEFKVIGDLAWKGGEMPGKIYRLTEEDIMARVGKTKFMKMFDRAGISRGELLTALRTMGKKHINGKVLKEQWSEKNPTRNYCYVVSEFLHWYVAPVGSQAYSVEVEGDDAVHVFMRWPKEQLVDLTCDQFPDISKVIYDNAKKKSFMQSGGPGPSKRAKILAEHLGFTDDDILTEKFAKPKAGGAKKKKAKKPEAGLFKTEEVPVPTLPKFRELDTLLSKRKKLLASLDLDKKATDALDGLTLAEPELPEIAKTMEYNKYLEIFVPKKATRIYSGDDEIDGIQVFLPPKKINKNYYNEYTPHEDTVCTRDDYKRGKNVPIGVKKFGIPVVEKVNGFYVVRDDLLAGGSKCRMIYDLIASGDNEEWVYASPAQGYAQVALAICTAMCGKRTIIYMAKSKEMHPLTRKAWEYGAEIRMVPMGFLSNLTAKANRYVQQNPKSALVPFGADHPKVRDQMGRAVELIPYKPKEVWSVLSTGTLSRGIQRGWPQAQFNGVMVGHVPDVLQRGVARVFKAPGAYTQNTRVIPPFPSARSYDAKVWQFMLKYANKGAAFWNVGA